MKREDLIALAELCEQQLMEDWNEIAKLNERIHEAAPGEVKIIIPPDYCRSIDSALQLVPEGWVWAYLDGSAIVRKPEAFKHTYGTSATPALALCAAALRAQGEK